ncbi:MAG TPA: hypothetical protein PK668_10910 [Myxococcota bacterium]|nr:hypothetical protein [Myxococcota bacterium]HRY93326.1 hypothetical protein [Myxococcota bacterium]HSA19875.1 hypothetical protein [Myxococcota bacterium]
MRRPSPIPATLLLALLGLAAPMGAASESDDQGDPPECFFQGQLRGGLSWDNVSAMETGVLRFGGTAGVFVVNGLELGYEQQFIVPPSSRAEARSWLFLRFMPFRVFPLAPFAAVRAGYYGLPEDDAGSFGAGAGAILFLDRHFALEVSMFVQGVFFPTGKVERQTDFDTRAVIYF